MLNLAGQIPFALRAMAVLPLVVVAMQGQAADGPTDTDCENAWTTSTASGSCDKDTSGYYIIFVQASVDTTKYNVVASNNECRVEVDCLQSETNVPPLANEFSGSPDQVESLSNCGGTLKEGNC